MDAFWNIFGVFVGFVLGIIADQIKDFLFSPRPNISFCDNDNHFSRTIDYSPHTRIGQSAVYMRVSVKNESRRALKNCRMYLVSISYKESEESQFEKTKFKDSICMSWSCKGDYSYEPLEIPSGITQFCDVCRTRPDAPSFMPCIQFRPFVYEDIFQKTGWYCFEIILCGENFKSAEQKIYFYWDRANSLELKKYTQGY